MPELPEVETVVRTLEPAIVNRTITSVEVLDDRILRLSTARGWQQPASVFISALEGRTITSRGRRGKFMLWGLSPRETDYEPQLLLVHLGMVGVLQHDNANLDGLDRNTRNNLCLLLHLDDGSVLAYGDYRRFGCVGVIGSVTALAKHPTLSKMAPEPFETPYMSSFEAEEAFLRTIRLRKWNNKMIKPTLLEQEVITGVGNIYASEACHRSRLDPCVLAQNLSDDALRDLFRSCVYVMSRAIELGGSTISDYRNGRGEAGSAQSEHKVYGHTVCECGTAIQSYELKGRNTYSCPSCQPDQSGVLKETALQTLSLPDGVRTFEQGGLFGYDIDWN